MEGTCMLCKEHITNPLSLDSLGHHIEQWLPSRLGDDFRRFHTMLKQMEEHGVGDSSLFSEQVICIHCYIKELYQWLMRTDGELAEKFLRIFSFGYKKGTFESSEEAPPPDFHGVESRFGICDECGEYSNDLVSDTGEWVCEECAW